MAKKKNKKIGQMVVLLLVMVLLIVGYVVFRNVKNKSAKKDKDSTETTIDLIKTDNKINTIEIKTSKDDVTLIRKDGSWRFKDQPEIKLDDTITKNIESTLKDLSASRVVEKEPKDLTTYGLDQPEIVATATADDNTSNTVSIGMKATTGDYYAQVNDSQVVYLIGGNAYSRLNYTKSRMIVVPDSISVNENCVTHLEIDDKKKGVLELKYDEKNPYDYTGTGTADWTVMKGYPSPVPGDTTGITDYLKKYNTIDFKECVSYDCKDLAKYGLDDPETKITMDYYEMVDKNAEEQTDNNNDKKLVDRDTAKKEIAKAQQETANQNIADKAKDLVKKEHTLNLEIGKYDDKDTVYYVKEGNSNDVYEVDAATIDGFLSFDKFSCIYRSIQLIKADTIKTIDMDLKGQKSTLAVTQEKVKDDDGKEDEQNVYSINGKKLDDESGKELFKEIIGFRYDAELPKDAEVKTSAPIATFTFHRTKGYDDITFSYYTFDSSFYAVSMNNDSYFLADKRNVDAAIDVINQAAK